MTTERILMKETIRYALFNRLPTGKTLEDIPEQERYHYDSPIRTFAEHELPRAEKIRDEINRVRADKEDGRVVIRTQTVFRTPWVDVGTTYTQLALF